MTYDFRNAKLPDMQTGRALLRSWLKRSEMLQRDFAGEISITEAYLSQVLSGKRRPSLPISVRIEDRTGIPVRSWLPSARGESGKTAGKQAKTRRVSRELSHAV